MHSVSAKVLKRLGKDVMDYGGLAISLSTPLMPHDGQKYIEKRFGMPADNQYTCSVLVELFGGTVMLYGGAYTNHWDMAAIGGYLSLFDVPIRFYSDIIINPLIHLFTGKPSGYSSSEQQMIYKASLFIEMPYQIIKITCKISNAIKNYFYEIYLKAKKEMEFEKVEKRD